MSGARGQRVIITGGTGMIARALRFGERLSRDQLDVTNSDQTRYVLARLKPSAVLHLAALDIRGCHAQPLVGYRTNVLGSHNIAIAAREVGARLVFLSSGAVFNGERGTVHTERAQPDPVNLYGQTKQIAEVLLAETLEDMLIVRTGWVFGGHQAHHQKFVDLAIEKALRGEPIHATNDQWGSPTFVEDLASELERLVLSARRGIAHVVNDGGATGKDIADEIVRLTGSRAPVMAVGWREFSEPGLDRSVSEVLSSSQPRLRHWRDALHEYVARRRLSPGGAS